MNKVRHYCITFWKKPNITSDKVRYAIFGEEIAPTTGKVHWQSYVEFTAPQRISTLYKHFDGDKAIRAEIRRGTRDQAREYCQKDGKYTEYGKWISGQGHRSDLDEVVGKLKNGTKLSEIMLEHPKTYCQYRNGLKDISATVTKNRLLKEVTPEVIVLSGPTGVGKSHRAVHEYGAKYMIKGKNLDWWQDYEGQNTVVIDEYSNNVSCDELLNLTGKRYLPLRLNVKGSHTYANWTRLIITTNLRREQLHSNALPEHRNAMFRRISTWVDLWPIEEAEVDTSDDDSDESFWDEEVQGNTEAWT